MLLFLGSIWIVLTFFLGGVLVDGFVSAIEGEVNFPPTMLLFIPWAILGAIIRVTYGG